MFKKILIVLLAMGLILPVGVVMAGKGPGGPGGGGGGDIPDTGELFGDLYVILRDVYGVPILDANNCIQPISALTDETTIAIEGGTLTIYATAGEPFALPTYTDTAGDLVECELTEDMADWVQAVDFGRLNLGRAPEGVIAHAFDEAINKMNTATDMKLDPAGRLMLLLDGEWFTIDAPAENLALYVKMMIDGHWITINTDPIVKGGKPEGKGPPEGDGPSTEDRPILNDTAIALLGELGFLHLGNVIYDENGNPLRNTLNNNELILATSLFAGAADKSGTITLDKVVYINSIYGINQVNSIDDPDYVNNGAPYFDFGDFGYDRRITYPSRSSGDCNPGEVYVLQPEADTDNDPSTLHFVTTCMSILGFNTPDYNAVRFVDMTEGYTTVFDEFGNPLSYNFSENVRAFTQAADDALQVIEYIHNYSVPEVLYP